MILGTEVNEFVTNRQQSKIHFLQAENNQLQEYIRDLENSLRLNKQAMKIQLEQPKRKGLQDDNSTTIYSSQDSKQQLDKYEGLLKHLNQENIALFETLSKVQKNTTTTSTKALLQEQISEETQHFYKDLIQDLEDKLIELKRNIHDKEYAIQELERIKPIFEREGQLIKVIEIMTPSEQTLKMHEELENIRSLLAKVTSESQVIIDQNKVLREVNYNLKREVYKLRIVLRSQVAHYIMKDFVYNEYIEKNDKNLQLTYEIQSHRGKLEQLHQDMYGQGSLGYGFSPEPQQLKYLSKNERMIYQEKLHKMEMMLKGFRELFEKEKMINLQTCQKYNALSQNIAQLQDTNELLIKSNKLKDERMEKLSGELNFHQKQLNQYCELLKTRRNNFTQPIQLDQQQDIALFSPIQSSKNQQSGEVSNRQLFQAARKERQNKMSLDFEQNQAFQSINIEGPLTDRGQDVPTFNQTPQGPKTLSKKPQLKCLVIEEINNLPEKDGNYCQTSRENNTHHHVIRPKDTVSQYYDMSLQECRDYLVTMSSEYSKSYNYQVANMQKKQMMKVIAGQPAYQKKLRRSNSDPFGYFSKQQQEDVIIFRRPPKISALHMAKNEIHVILEEIQQQKQTQRQKVEKQQEKENPFELDVSQIQDMKKFQMEPNSTRNRKTNVLIDAELSFASNCSSDDDSRDMSFDENLSQK